MDINILPVEESPQNINSANRLALIQKTETTTNTLEEIFAKFLMIEVGDGAASPDTIRNYLSHTKQFFNWCQDSLISPVEADKEDIKLYRQHLIEQNCKHKTIATKLNIIRRFYQSLIDWNQIEVNPAVGVKAPLFQEDPAARITFLEAEELKCLLEYLQSKVAQAKTNKARLICMRDRALIGIMSLEGTRTIELHQLKLAEIVRQGNNTGLRVFAKRSSRIVPLTYTLASGLEEYLVMRRKVLRRKIKPEDYVFISVSNNSKNKQLSRRSIREIVDRALVATDLKHRDGRTISAHSLRHTAGTQALRAGADLRQVQDLLGHADPRTTAIYAHVGDRWEHNPGADIEKKLNQR